MSRDEVFDVRDCVILRETDAAIQVELQSGEKIWFPFSQVEAVHREGGAGNWLVVTRWIAEKKGLL